MDYVSLLLLLLFLLTGRVYLPAPAPAERIRPPAAEWCWYGRVQVYLRCPPAHGVKPPP